MVSKKLLIGLILFTNVPLRALEVTPSSETQLAEWSQKVINLRSESETLSREIDQGQKEKQAELDVWRQKQLELTSTLQKENLRQLQIRYKKEALKKRVLAGAKSDPKAKLFVLSWVAQAKDWVLSSLPFRQEQRLKTLENLEERARRGFEGYELLAAELLQFYESEFKMASETAYKVIEDKEVVRLGFYSLYSRAIGHSVVQKAAQVDNQWDLTLVTGEEAKAAERLFTNLKSKKSAGFYEVNL